MVETDTTQYEFTHGRKPRGFGSWAFNVTVANGRGGFLVETIRPWTCGTLAECRKEAVRRAKEIGRPVLVEVLP